jgi:uncharacterized glyoxalase superfamily protein PhnB
MTCNSAIAVLSRSTQEQDGITARLLQQHCDGGGCYMMAQMRLDGQRIMLGQSSKEWCMLSPRDTEAATVGVFVYLANVDAHHERAKAAGAEIVQPPYDEPYGRTYTVRDLDGHPWFFTTPPVPQE